MNWNDISECTTFDVIVECEAGDPTREESKSICDLGYYGRVCSKENVENFKKGLPWEAKSKYGVTAELIDGPLEKWFSDKEEAIAYVVARYEY